MEELNGSLQSISLLDIIRFLHSLGKSGSLRFPQARWEAHISFATGTVVAASFELDQGLDAIEATALLLGDGRFSFWDGNPTADRNIETPTPDLLRHLQEALDQHGATAEAILSGKAVLPARSLASITEITLDGPAIEMLLAANQHRTLAEIAVGRGMAQTIHQASRLLNLGLITFDTEGTAPAEENAAEVGITNGRPRDRVLVIEDDPEITELFTEVLDRGGYEVSATDSALGAAALIRELHPSAVLLDLGLPYRPGSSLLAELKANPETAGVPVVVVSGMTETLSEQRREQADAVLSKPVLPAALLETVERAARRELS
jgi:CheY-like chemotaxis protein